nr:unnamed protein product [Callosobruchus chinensis]
MTRERVWRERGGQNRLATAIVTLDSHYADELLQTIRHPEDKRGLENKSSNLQTPNDLKKIYCNAIRHEQRHSAKVFKTSFLFTTKLEAKEAKGFSTDSNYIEYKDKVSLPVM